MPTGYVHDDVRPGFGRGICASKSTFQMLTFPLSFENDFPSSSSQLSFDYLEVGQSCLGLKRGGGR